MVSAHEFQALIGIVGQTVTSADDHGVGRAIGEPHTRSEELLANFSAAVLGNFSVTAKQNLIDALVVVFNAPIRT